MKQRIVKLMSVVTVMAVLIVSFASVGTVSAQDDATPPVDAPGAPGEGAGGPGRGRRGDGLLETVAEALDLEVDELREEIIDGDLTLAEVIEAHDGDLDAIMAEIETEAADRLAEAVGDGKLTEEKAEEMLAARLERLEESFNTVPSERPERPEAGAGEIPGNGDFGGRPDGKGPNGDFGGQQPGGPGGQQPGGPGGQRPGGPGGQQPDSNGVDL